MRIWGHGGRVSRTGFALVFGTCVVMGDQVVRGRFGKFWIGVLDGVEEDFRP